MRDILISELRDIQKKEGYISEEAMKKISAKFDMPISKIYSVVSFYSMFYTEKQGKFIIEMCNSPSCYLNGSLDMIKHLEKKLNIKSGQTSKDGKFSLHIGSCIGCCDKSPAMRINGKGYFNLDKKKIDNILDKFILDKLK